MREILKINKSYTYYNEISVVWFYMIANARADTAIDTLNVLQTIYSCFSENEIIFNFIFKAFIFPKWHSNGMLWSSYYLPTAKYDCQV